MKVRFKRMFIGPDGNRYRADLIHTLPDLWKPRLPKTAQVLPEEVVAVEPNEKVEKPAKDKKGLFSETDAAKV